MSAVIEVHDLTKRYRDVTAVDDVSFSVQQNVICGLLGRNGAGKTTLMQLLTGQEFATRGDLRVFGESPVENAGVLHRLSFIKESQKYPTTSGRSTCSPVRRGSSRTGTPSSPAASSTSSGCR